MASENTPSNFTDKQDKKMKVAITIAIFGLILFVALAIMFQG